MTTAVVCCFPWLEVNFRSQSSFWLQIIAQSGSIFLLNRYEVQYKVYKFLSLFLTQTYAVRTHLRNERFHRFWYGKVEKTIKSSSTFRAGERDEGWWRLGGGVANEKSMSMLHFPHHPSLSTLQIKRTPKLPAGKHTHTQSAVFDGKEKFSFFEMKLWQKRYCD